MPVEYKEWMIKVMKACITDSLSSKHEGMKCGVVEGVICNSLRWSGGIKGIVGSEILRVYVSVVDAVGARGWPPVKWETEC